MPIYQGISKTFLIALGEQAWKKKYLFYFGWDHQSYTVTVVALMWKWEQLTPRLPT